MILNVSYNNDVNLAKEIPVSEDVQVNLVGAANQDIVGSDRPVFLLKKTNDKELEQAVEICNKRSVGFIYALDGTCTGNREFTRKWQKQFKRRLTYLHKIGIQQFRFSNPYLLQRARHILGDKVQLHVSRNALIDSPKRALYWQEMKADSITVNFFLNRNFNVLQSIAKTVDVPINLTLNAPCILGCPFENYHGMEASHSSSSFDTKGNFLLDYCALKCVDIKFSRTKELLKIPFIRPEDLKVYEDMGISSFEIMDRKKSTEWLVKVTNVYLNRSFRGNMMDLLPNPMLKEADSYTTKPRMKYFIKPWHINVSKLKRFKDISLTQVEIPNDKLDGFIDFFKENDCDSLKCSECKYCEDKFENIGKAQLEENQKSVENIRALISDLETGAMY